MLYDAVTIEGIEVRTGRSIAGSHLDKTARRHLVFEDGSREGPFDLIVDALGTRTALAPDAGKALAYGALWANLDWPDDASLDDGALEQRYRAASVMAGILPIGKPPGSARSQAAFFWSLRADRLDAWQATGLAGWKADVCDLWPQCDALFKSNSRYRTANLRSLRSPNAPASGRTRADPYRRRLALHESAAWARGEHGPARCLCAFSGIESRIELGGWSCQSCPASAAPCSPLPTDEHVAHAGVSIRQPLPSLRSRPSGRPTFEALACDLAPSCHG